MKTLILILSFFILVPTICFCQSDKKSPKSNDWYVTQLNIADSLIGIGLPRDAEPIFNQMIERSRKEKNHVMLLRSINGRMINSCLFEEDAFLKVVSDLRAELPKMEFPVNQIAHSILANLYWNYYQNNRWEINQITDVAKSTEPDIETWGFRRIIDEVIGQVDSSLLHPDQLSKIPVEAFDGILTGEKKNRHLRPSLYELLAFRALDVFRNHEVGLITSADAFTLNDPVYFGDANQFANSKIITNDSTSLLFRSIRIYQQLTQLHLNDKPNDALVDLEKNRLDFVRTNCDEDYRSPSYRNAMRQLVKVADSPAMKAEILYWLGWLNYSESSHESKIDMESILALCDSVITQYPGTEGSKQCKNLKEVILDDDLYMQATNCIVPDNPFLIKLEYKNLDKVFFRLYQVNSTSPYLQEGYLERPDTILDQLPIKEWSQSLPDSGDFKTRHVEIPIEGLKRGFYVLVVSNRADYSKESKTVAVSFCSTNLFCSERSLDGVLSFLLTERQSGRPVENVQVKILKRNYDEKQEKTIYEYAGNCLSNREGIVDYKTGGSDIKAIASLKGDTLLMRDVYNYNQKFRGNWQETYIYTDRAIYRPGQTVYFKGLMLSTNNRKSEVVKSGSERVRFIDANWNELVSLNVTSNEYGTFSGSFVIPAGEINGTFRIMCGGRETEIQVEEYKRPAFEVVLDSIKQTYSFNDSVLVSGCAKAFAGYPIGNAKVAYRIQRRVESRWYWCEPEWDNQFITNDSTTTDPSGKFGLSFFADGTTLKNKEQIYVYSIDVDVTDANGETHSSTQRIKISNSPLMIVAEIPEHLFERDLSNLKIKTTTINGTAAEAEVSIEISRLKCPGILFGREWETPNTFLMSESSFRKKFPSRVYRNENDIDSWKEDSVVFSQTYPSAKEIRNFDKMLASIKYGYYRFKIKAVNSENDSATWNKTIKLNGAKPQKALCISDWIVPVKTVCEPGDSAEYWITYLTPSSPVRFEMALGDSIVESKWLFSDDKVKVVKIPITDRHVGGFVVQFLQIAWGIDFSFESPVKVLRTDKNLDISFNSFRNKLLPGQSEQWQLTIKNVKGEKENAELLTTLYDASLDDFVKLEWNTQFYRDRFNYSYSWNSNINRFYHFDFTLFYNEKYLRPWERSYEALNLACNYWEGYNFYFEKYKLDLERLKRGEIDKISLFTEIMDTEEIVFDKSKSGNSPPPPPPPPPAAEQQVNYVAPVVVDEVKEEIERSAANETVMVNHEKQSGYLSQISTRKNFNETAFFYPHLLTNEKGEITISFTMPEALTRWKLMGFAHTKDLKTGTITREIITQKDVAIMANAPRFLRENDTIEFTANVNNISENDITGDAMLELFNPYTNEIITSSVLNSESVLPFSLKRKGGKTLRWKLVIPNGIKAVGYKAVAKAGEFTDGEEAVLPVLPQKTLVTESLPFTIRPKQTRKYSFDKLINNKSNTLQHQSYTIELTSNPVWSVVQSMPYLMEFPHECAEQVFSRYYANTLSTAIMNSNPTIKRIFDTWQLKSPEAFLSSLEKNQELKGILLQETPWLLESKNEDEQKRRIAMLFDLNQMNSSINMAWEKLKQKQNHSGGFAWFEGMTDDRIITQHIVTGLEQLMHLDLVKKNQYEVDQMVAKAQLYLDRLIVDDYNNRFELLNPNENHLTVQQVHYLYGRSFSSDSLKEGRLKEACDYLYGQAKEYWLTQREYAQGMLALTFFRKGDKELARQIIKSLSNRAVRSAEMGMYWPGNLKGYSWYESPVETQAMLIEAFNEVAHDTSSVEEMKIWLLRNKQTISWGTTKATTAACYALLLRGVDQLAALKPLKVKIANKPLKPLAENAPEAGTGYLKTTFIGKEVKAPMGKIKVQNPNRGIAWGAAYWSYSENLDKITSAETNLSIKKKIFVKKYTEKGAILVEINKGSQIVAGDEVVVRMELRADRDYEYVHLKDLRAAGFETIAKMSGYKYQQGLGYYESIKDASENFFIDHLKKGVYLLEYSLRATHAGSFSNGIATIECMYAPEFRSHTESQRIRISSN